VRLVTAIVLAIVIGACGSPSAAPTPTHPANVPCGPTEVFIRHEHTHLTILIRGEVKTVPAFIGITAGQICWLHTHNTSGIIHIESGDNRTLTLADLFAVWRQPLTQTVIDGDSVGNGESVQATVNQQPYTGAPETIVLRNREDIVLQLGPPFLTLQPFVWPPRY
jgi:peptidase E